MFLPFSFLTAAAITEGSATTSPGFTAAITVRLRRAAEGEGREARAGRATRELLFELRSFNERTRDAEQHTEAIEGDLVGKRGV